MTSIPHHVQDIGTVYSPTIPPRVNGPGHVSSFERGGPLARGAMFLLSKGGSIDTRTGGPLTRVLVKKSKKNSLCMHFLARNLP